MDNSWITPGEGLAPSFFDYDYFENGPASRKSNYDGYRWYSSRFHARARQLLAVAGVSRGSRVIDFGCAKGYLVRALIEKGYNAHGCDISSYAILNADPLVRDRCYLLDEKNAVDKLGVFDLVIARHVLEHVSERELSGQIESLFSAARQIVAEVPLGNERGYTNPRHNRDASHLIARDAVWWSRRFRRAGAQTVQTFVSQWYEGQPDELLLVATI